MDDLVVLLDKPSRMWREGGLVHFEDRSGKVVFRRVMPIHIALANYANFGKIIADWQAEQDAPKIVEFKRKRR